MIANAVDIIILSGLACLWLVTIMSIALLFKRTRIWKERHVGVVIAITSLVLAFSAGALRVYLPDQKEAAAFSFLLITGLVSATFGYAVRGFVKVSELGNAIDYFKQDYHEQARMAGFAYKLTQFHPIIQNTGLETMRSQMRSLIGTDEGFFIDGTD